MCGWNKWYILPGGYLNLLLLTSILIFQIPRCEKRAKESCLDTFDAINCRAAYIFCESEIYAPVISSGMLYWHPKTNDSWTKASNWHRLQPLWFVKEVVCLLSSESPASFDCHSVKDQLGRHYAILSPSGSSILLTIISFLIKILTPATRNISDFLDRPDIREAIGVDPSITSNYSSCSSKVGIDFYNSMDAEFPTQFYIAALLERGVRTLLYVGANDWICNWVSVDHCMCRNIC